MGKRPSCSLAKLPHIAAALFQYGASTEGLVDNFNQRNPAPLLTAAMTSGNSELIRVLLAHCNSDPLVVNCTRSTARGHTALHLCEDPESARVLIRNGGANVNAVDLAGRTPIFYQTMQGHNRTVVDLIDAGADVSARDLQGVTPLHTAATSGRSDLLELLCHFGADINARSHEVEDGGDGDDKKIFYDSPLTSAVVRRQGGIVQDLLGLGASVQIGNAIGASNSMYVPLTVRSLMFVRQVGAMPPL